MRPLFRTSPASLAALAAGLCLAGCSRSSPAPDAGAAPPPSRVDIHFQVKGALAEEVVRAAVRPRLGEIFLCLQEPRAQLGALELKLPFRIAIAPDGKVGSVDLPEGAAPDYASASCLRQRVATWAFPTADGPTEAAIRYELSLPRQTHTR